MANELAAAYITLIPSLKGAQAAISKQLGGIDTSGAGKTMGAKAGGGFAKGLLGVGAIAGAAASITSAAMNAISSAMDGAIKRTDTMNNFPKVMQNLGYSATDAEKSIKTMSDRLIGLPTSLDSMTGMVQQLAPLTGGLDSATNIGLAFNDMLLASGKGTEDQTRAMQQYTQMLGKGAVDLQSWRTLQEVMPGQLNQVAQALLGPTANSQALYDALKDGTLSMDEFNNAILDLDANGANGFASFSEQAKDATKGIGTSLTNIKTATERAISGVLDAIGQDTISNAFGSIIPIIGGIGNVFVTMVNMVKASGLG
ncbi:tape measure protein, partial [Eubacterium sp.]|uniref:tape measure protein n=1 Tax=Eubacterium sp. TaxID=142586 RepID=UPI002FC9E6F9